MEYDQSEGQQNERFTSADTSEESNLSYSSMMADETGSSSRSSDYGRSNSSDVDREFGKLEIVDSGASAGGEDGEIHAESLNRTAGKDDPQEGGEEAPGGHTEDNNGIQRDRMGRIVSERTPDGNKTFEYIGDSSTLSSITISSKDGQHQKYTRDADGNMVGRTADGTKVQYRNVNVNQGSGEVVFYETNGERFSQSTDGSSKRFDSTGRPTFEKNTKDGTTTVWDHDNNQKSVYSSNTGRIESRGEIPPAERSGDHRDKVGVAPEPNPRRGAEPAPAPEPPVKRGEPGQSTPKTPEAPEDPERPVKGPDQTRPH